MNNYLKSKNKLNKEYFNSLVAMAMADGKLMEEEIEFFNLKATELGFPITSIEEMISSNTDDVNGDELTKIDDVDFLTDIVAMAMIDGKLHEKEYKLCVSMAERRSFSQKDVDDTIKQLKEFFNYRNI
jgi:uncharacterized tellurite resistance protein B-like protein